MLERKGVMEVFGMTKERGNRGFIKASLGFPKRKRAIGWDSLLGFGRQNFLEGERKATLGPNCQDCLVE